MSADEYHIVAGETYVYTRDLPRGCKGGRYRVRGFVLDVPSYQEKVLVEAVSGKDKGLWFTCSPANFSYRYELLEAKEPMPPASKSIDLVAKGTGA